MSFTSNRHWSTYELLTCFNKFTLPLVYIVCVIFPFVRCTVIINCSLTNTSWTWSWLLLSMFFMVFHFIASILVSKKTFKINWLHANTSMRCIGFVLSIQNGTRHLISHDFNTDSVDNLHFYLRIGGSNRIKCQGSNKRQNNVLLQFSTDGGITWKLLKELFHEDFREPR